MLKVKDKTPTVYEVLSKIIGLKFHSQLKDSGIEFESIYLMTNLVTGKENFLVIVNGQQIRFVDAYGFILHFCILLTSNINYYEQEYSRLTNLRPNEFTDEVAVEMACKEMDYFRFKQKELLIKFAKFKLKNRR